MTEPKKLSLAIFETPERCDQCPCAHFSDYSECCSIDDYCKYKYAIDGIKEWIDIERGSGVPEWCPLKPVVFDEDYAE